MFLFFFFKKRAYTYDNVRGKEVKKAFQTEMISATVNLINSPKLHYTNSLISYPFYKM